MLFRTLQAEDIPPLYEPESRGPAAEWLRQQAAGQVHVVVAELDGVPLGRRCLQFEWNRADDAAYCFAFGVLPEWRSRGIGTAIDRHCEEVARSRGFGALRCGVVKNNPRGLAWHQRLGYRIIQERSLRWQDMGVERVTDCWMMERRWKDGRSLRARLRSVLSRLP
jgi:ribosomal protein S18 acetylase RimI-like enzyme